MMRLNNVTISDAPYSFRLTFKLEQYKLILINKKTGIK